MLIQCTKKLQNELDVTFGTDVGEDNLFSWHANLITINRRKTVVLINDKSKYRVVLYGLKAKDFKNFHSLVVEAIGEVLREECVDEEIIGEFVKKSREGVEYTKAKDRGFIAKLNKACEDTHFFQDLIENGSVIQPTLSAKISDTFITVGNGYTSPNEDMYKVLESFAGKKVFNCQAVKIKITLDLDNKKVWRRLVIPANTSFKKFHGIIQETFGWQNCHLHEFFVLGNDKVGKPERYINNPVYTKEEFVPIKLETGVRLSEYLPARMKYIYDFGDTWQHHIEVEETIENYDKNYPICLTGEGKTPPEDVGGAVGYQYFLKVINDKNHPEHEEMLNWGEMQGYEEFDLEDVNRSLRYI